MQKHNKVEIRIINVTKQTLPTKYLFLDWFHEEGQDLVFQSPLDATHSVSDHLKWFYSMFLSHRRSIRQLEAAGIAIICRVRHHERSLLLEPEALLLGHQLHIQTKIEYVD